MPELKGEMSRTEVWQQNEDVIVLTGSKFIHVSCVFLDQESVCSFKQIRSKAIVSVQCPISAYISNI